MEMNLADAKARFSEVVDRAEAGESVDILRRGRLVARVVPVERTFKKIDVESLRAFTATLPWQEQSSVELLRELRDEERY